MKRRRRASKSTFRAELIVQKQRDEESGLYVSDRFFQPALKQRTHHIRWTLMNALMLGCLVLGMLRLLMTGVGLAAEIWFYPAAALMCLIAAAIYQSEWCAKHWYLLAVPGLLAYLTALFFMQNIFLLGMQQMVNIGVEQLNIAYSGSLSRPFATGGSDAVQVFLAFVTVPVVLWLANAVLQSGMPILMELLVFPVTAALLLMQSANDALGQLVLMFGVVLALAFMRTKRQKRMWGGANAELLHDNRLRFEEIQKTSAVAVLIISMAVTLPGLLLIRPLLDTTLEPARQVSDTVKTDALNRVMKLLPDLTAGRWNLNVEAVGGGVQDGSIGSETGYLLEGVEDLRLTVNRKPDEALFLRGYIGVNYEQGSWKPAHAYTFDGAAINWNTEGSPRLYIHNLPFLRTAFASNQGGSSDEEIAQTMSRFNVAPVQLFVERINANPNYTYVPYGAYLNDYYEIDAGDGAVKGQKEQEDRYFFFTRKEMEDVLEAWNSIEATANVLDRVEESYRAFCNTTCVAVMPGLEELQAEIDAVKAEERWHPARDTEEISQWIRRYMAENYGYQLIVDAAPEGEDALSYFLFTSKKGNSIHFASAAVMLYRMFGVPARYVVGYEVSPSLFTVQAGGIYTSVVQGDNSQAWAEIYVPGIGWTPKDMTPGVIGTLEEVGLGGIRVESGMEDEDDQTEEEVLPELTEDDVIVRQTETDIIEPNEPLFAFSMEEIIIGIAGTVAAVAALMLVIGLIRRTCRNLGITLLRRKKNEVVLLGVFQAVFRRVRRLKLPKDVDSQSSVFVTFVEHQLRIRGSKAEALVQEAVTRMYAGIYGSETLTKADILRMRKILLGLYGLKKKQKGSIDRTNDGTKTE